MRSAAAADLVRAWASGYGIQVAPEDIDVHQFRGLIRRSHRAMEADDPTGAPESLERALGMWRGAPLRDIVAGPHCGSAGTEWEEEYLSAREDAFWLRLRAGEARPARVPLPRPPHRT